MEQHHDVRRLPNGNTLYIGWEILPKEAVNRVRGGIPNTEHNGNIYGDYLHEVTPEGKVTWEWHAHLDMEIENYPICPVCNRNEFAHANTCFPMDDGNVMVSFRRINLIAVIDYKTKKFKWERRDDSWGHQHDCQILENGNILVFANGIHWSTGQAASRIVEFEPLTGNLIWEYQGSPFPLDVHLKNPVRNRLTGAIVPAYQKLAGFFGCLHGNLRFGWRDFIEPR